MEKITWLIQYTDTHVQLNFKQKQDQQVPVPAHWHIFIRNLIKKLLLAHQFYITSTVGKTLNPNTFTMCSVSSSVVVFLHFKRFLLTGNLPMQANKLYNHPSLSTCFTVRLAYYTGINAALFLTLNYLYCRLVSVCSITKYTGKGQAKQSSKQRWTGFLGVTRYKMCVLTVGKPSAACGEPNMWECLPDWQKKVTTHWL